MHYKQLYDEVACSIIQEINITKHANAFNTHHKD